MQTMPYLTTIQLALALEAVANVLSATGLLLYPLEILNLLTATPSSTASLLNPSSAPPAATYFLQWLAALTYGLTPPLLFALPEHRGARDKRWTAYITLGSIDMVLIPLMVWQALMWGSDDGGLTRRALLGCAGGLLPFMVWRVWVLGFRPELLEKSGESGKME